MKHMKHIKREEYKKFVEQHILWPYQSMVLDNEENAIFTDLTYSMLPMHFDRNPEWTEKVFNRIAGIFNSIDQDFFPAGATRFHILSKMQAVGISINWK